MFPLNRFVCSVITTSRADCHDYIGERMNQDQSVTSARYFFYSRIETMSLP